jgi:hypothetical protein
MNDVSNYSTMEQSGEAEKRADKAMEMGGGTFWFRIEGRTPFDFGENVGKVLMEMEKRRGAERRGHICSGWCGAVHRSFRILFWTGLITGFEKRNRRHA